MQMKKLVHKLIKMRENLKEMLATGPNQICTLLYSCLIKKYMKVDNPNTILEKCPSPLWKTFCCILLVCCIWNL